MYQLACHEHIRKLVNTTFLLLSPSFTDILWGMLEHKRHIHGNRQLILRLRTLCTLALS